MSKYVWKSVSKIGFLCITFQTKTSGAPSLWSTSAYFSSPSLISRPCSPQKCKKNSLVRMIDGIYSVGNYLYMCVRHGGAETRFHSPLSALWTPPLHPASPPVYTLSRGTYLVCTQTSRGVPHTFGPHTVCWDTQQNKSNIRCLNVVPIRTFTQLSVTSFSPKRKSCVFSTLD